MCTVKENVIYDIYIILFGNWSAMHLIDDNIIYRGYAIKCVPWLVKASP